VWVATFPDVLRAQAATPPPLDLTAALDVARGLPRLHSFLVSWRGVLVAERYFNGATSTRPANIKSASKTVISALVGIAIHRGLIADVDTPIASFFPGQLKDERKLQITIEDLLTMRSGLESTSSQNYGAWVTSRNWVHYALNRPLIAEPGTTMQYSTGNTHLLSAILTQASKSSTWRFAQEALATPLGFTLPAWPRDPQGVYFGGNDMLMTPRQMLAFGELYLRGGRSAGRQVLTAAWVEQSFVPRGRSPRSEQLYGYGWWIRELAGHQASYAWGYGGQYIFVIPDLDLVIVTTSSSAVGEERRSHRVTVFELVERLVVPSIHESLRAAVLHPPVELIPHSR
jgi:CubicO group peptidase (beta-lactamase class C family)